METSPVQLIKLAVVAHTGLSKDAIHIYVGLVIFFCSALLLRKPLGSLVPWFAVLLASCALEVPDAIDDIRSFGYWRIAASTHDIVNTLVWPTAILALARFTRLFGTDSGAGAA